MKNWFSSFGEFLENGERLTFKGRLVKLKNEQSGGFNQFPSIGIILYKTPFITGTISCGIVLNREKSKKISCQIIFNYINNNGSVSYNLIGIHTEGEEGNPGFVFSKYDGNSYDTICTFGSSANIKDNETINMRLSVIGARIVFFVNDILAYTGDIPQPIISSQIGISCQCLSDINFQYFNVKTTKPKAFIIMQFDKPYDELFDEVILPTCDESYDVTRADKSYSTGMIMTDIINQIIESSLVIADITPDNPNVFYEVGYAHALKKPTILLTEKTKREKLPFDVSGFRVIFYENTIGGKKDVCLKLKQFLNNINNI